MSNLNTHGVTDYQSAERFLGPNRSRRTLCYATTVTHEGHAITVRHHDTAIVRYWDTGIVEIRNGGYLSRTTTDRLNRLTSYGVHVSFAKGGSVESPFYSGPQPYDWNRVE